MNKKGDDTGSSFHAAVAIRFYRRQVLVHWGRVKDDFKANGKPVTRTQALEYLKELEEKGYEVIPPCDKIKPNGMCAGHGQLFDEDE